MLSVLHIVDSSIKDSTSALHYAVKAVSTAIFSPANTAKLCRTGGEKKNQIKKRKKDHCCDRNTRLPELWLYTEMLIQRIVEPKEAVQSQFEKPGLQTKQLIKGGDLELLVRDSPLFPVHWGKSSQVISDLHLLMADVWLLTSEELAGSFNPLCKGQVGILWCHAPLSS